MARPLLQGRSRPLRAGSGASKAPARSVAAVLLVATGVGCNVGGRGGGPNGGLRLEPGPSRLLAPAADPVLRGRALYRANGCVLCHGDEGKGGVKNANSETGGEINGLTLVKEGYSEEELIEKIAKGTRKVGKDDPKGPTPPLRMPAFREWLGRGDLAALAAYLFSLYPEGRESAWDDWDAEQ